MSRCIICGSYTSNYKFCYDCYKKYNHNKENKVDNRRYKTKNGTLVRSKSELIICDILTDYGIKFQYEKVMNIRISDEYNNERDITIIPDIFIPELKFSDGKILKDVYIEHFGLLTQEEYKWKTVMKLMIYQQMGLTLICTEEKDIESAHETIFKKLISAEANKINY